MPSPREASASLQKKMDEVVTAVNKKITKLLPETDLHEDRLFEAMRYSALSGGKRLRPFLVVHSANLFNVDPRRSLRVAAAVEFVHCCSLIHDDLPAMDDSPTRRGKPAAHKAFDEATAILAGDALLALAFEILADPDTHEDPRVRIELVKQLAHAAGPDGLCGGQMLDLIGEHEEFDVGTISRMQRMKTGKLMAFACEAGAILGKSDEPHKKALCNFAHDLGLAFQVTDDVLDLDADPEETGKPANQDAAAGKSTFVTTMGKDAAQMRAEMLVGQAKRHLKVFGNRGETLSELAEYVLHRRA
ncbi:MAG TPA: polyprenyl synthetase family protein [Micavibrio sp.]|nr:polyprenyl synthetase family protein [Micavibrio sp.]